MRLMQPCRGLRALVVFALSASITVLVLFTLPAGSLFHGGRQIASGATDGCTGCHEENTQTAPGGASFLQMRRYGNPDVNIDAMRLRAWETLRRQTSAFARTSANSQQWVCIGPGNIAGRIRALAFHPSDGNILYAGAATGGVFKSTDGGLSWRPTMDDPVQAPTVSIGALAVDPRAPETVYAGTGEATIPLSKAIAAPVGSGIGVLRSSNGGASWNLLPWPQQASAISRIALHPNSSDSMLVASRSGLWRSGTSGTSWASVLSGTVTDVCYQERNTEVVFAALGSDFGDPRNGVYRSNNGGKPFSWTKLSVNFPPGDSTGRILLATTPADPTLVLALVARPITDDKLLALMRSTDAGNTWERVQTNLPVDFPLGQAFYNMCIAISPTQKNLVFVGGIEVYRSSDLGSTFYRTTFANLVIHVDQHAFAFQPGTGVLYVGNDGGVASTTNAGDSWERKDSSLVTSQFYSVTVDETNPGRVYGGTQDNGTVRLLNAPDRWQIIRGDVDGGAIVVDGNFMCTMGTLSIFPFRSTNGGQTWSTLRDGLDPGTDRPNWLQPLIRHPSDKSRLYTATQRVYEARGAESPSSTPVWKAVSPDLSGGSAGTESVVTAMAISPSDPERMYAGTGDGRLHRSTNILTAAPQWTDISAGLPKRWITDIAVKRDDPRVVLVTVSGFASGHVFLSTNAGAQWKDISGTGNTNGLPDIPCNAILLPPSSIPLVCIATDLGVFSSRYLADSVVWERIASPLENMIVTDLAIDQNHRLYAATHGRGVWVTDLVLDAHLSDRYRSRWFEIVGPMPLGGMAGNTGSAAFSIPERANVSLSLFNAMGSRVLAVQKGMFPPGEHRITFDVSGIPAGVYYCRFESETYTATRKIVLMR